MGDIFNFSQKKSIAPALSNGPFSLARLLEEAAEVLRGAVAEKQIELFFMVNKDLPLDLQDDSEQIKRILSPIASYAAQIIDQGEIVVSLEPGPGTPTAPAPAESPAAQIQLLCSVKVCASGLSCNPMPCVFQPFGKTGGTLKRADQDSGAGPHIFGKWTDKIQDGRLWIESAGSESLTFFFTLLLQAGSDRRTPRDLIPDDLKGLKVLVIDPSAAMCRHLGRILGEFDFEVKTARSTVEATMLIQAALNERPFDAIIADQTTTTLEEVETLAGIRSRYRTETAPKPAKCIFISNHDRKDRGKNFGLRRSDQNSYLPRPIIGTTLLATIADLFSKSRNVSQLSPKRLSQEHLPEKQPFAGAKVMLVEDDEINRDFAESLLRMMGFEVDVAVNGRLAVEQLHNCRRNGNQGYQAVLMDIEMPVMDGYTATRTLRGNPDFKDLPIIAMTAHTFEEIEKRCLKAGMDDWLCKPIDARQLHQTLGRFVKPPQDKLPAQLPLRPGPAEEVWEQLPASIDQIDLAPALVRMGGNTGLYRKVLRNFLAKFRDAEPKLRNCLTRNDLSQARRLIHSIKGTAGNIGARALHDACSKLNLHLKGDRTGELDSPLENFSTCHRRLIRSLDLLDLDAQDKQTGRQDRSTSQAAVDVDRIAPVVIDMFDLLRKCDSRVRHLLARLKKLLAGTRLEKLLKPLDEAVYQLDSDRAIESLTTIADALGVPLDEK